MASYTVREIFHSLQGEGIHAGRPAVFLRFAGCNLWSGREEDRAGAACRFCDTDFVGGEKFADAAALAGAVLRAGGDTRFVVVTGGEPGLQLDAALIGALHGLGFEVAVETNGTVELPAGLDWVCVSPKAGAPLVVTGGDELKLVHPQAGVDPTAFEALAFRHWFVQPMDGPDVAAATAACVAYCLAHPRWRVSVQTHKLLRIP